MSKYEFTVVIVVDDLGRYLKVSCDNDLPSDKEITRSSVLKAIADHLVEHGMDIQPEITTKQTDLSHLFGCYKE